MGSQDQLLDQIMQLKTQLRDLYFQHYMDKELFSGTWWVAVAGLILPLVVWWLKVDKKRLMEIAFFGLMVNIAATFLDVLGSEYMLWEYPVHVIPMVPLLIPIDYVIVPVIQMTLYQRYPNWKGFLIANTIASALQSFIAEPVAVWINLYHLIHWRLIYSFPIYILIAVAAKWFTERFMTVQMKSHAPDHPLKRTGKRTIRKE